MDDPAVLAAAPATSTNSGPLTHPEPPKKKGPAVGEATTASDCTPQALEQ